MKSTGISFLGVLGIAFIVLKLCEVIDWSWWYITMPLWGGLVVLVAIIIFVLIAAMWTSNKKKRQLKNRLAELKNKD